MVFNFSRDVFFIFIIVDGGCDLLGLASFNTLLSDIIFFTALKTCKDSISRNGLPILHAIAIFDSIHEWPKVN